MTRLLVLLALAPIAALAQADGGYAAPPGFEPVAGAGAAQVPIEPVPLVVIAYLFVWAATFGYILLLWRRQRRIAGELEVLSRRLDKAAED